MYHAIVSFEDGDRGRDGDRLPMCHTGFAPVCRVYPVSEAATTQAVFAVAGWRATMTADGKWYLADDDGLPAADITCAVGVVPTAAALADAVEIARDRVLDAVAGAYISRSESCRVRYGGEMLTTSIVERDANYSRCDRCGDYVGDDEVTPVGEEVYCQRCVGRHAWHCDECAAWFFDGTQCGCDEEEEEEPSIWPYHGFAHGYYVFGHRATGEPTFGAELEVEVNRGHDRERVAARAIGQMGRDFAHAESDGSLLNGFEIVTQPATIVAHRERWPRLQFPAGAVHSWTARECHCGFHVHIGRDCLSAQTIANLVLLFNRDANEAAVKGIAGRDSSRYAAKKVVDGAEPAELVSAYDRYERVNVTGKKTVEIRVFRGSTKIERILAYLDFVAAAVEFCRTAPAADTTFAKFAASVDHKRYPHLRLFPAFGR